jgi:hypothetical protein
MVVNDATSYVLYRCQRGFWGHAHGVQMKGKGYVEARHLYAHSSPCRCVSDGDFDMETSGLDAVDVVDVDADAMRSPWSSLKFDECAMCGTEMDDAVVCDSCGSCLCRQCTVFDFDSLLCCVCGREQAVFGHERVKGATNV